jgi:hypothetical protein
MIDLYRSPEEVFDPAAIASFEAKSITDNHPPAAKFVDPSNVNEYEMGHLQNVRKGAEPLDNGEWPLMADIVIKRQPLIQKVEDEKLRELSCGYDYTLARDGDRFLQTAIRGNHVAVVPKGRAGAEARINDSAPEPVLPEPIQRSTPEATPPAIRKEKLVVPKPVSMLKHILGLGLKAFAADADPESVADAVEAVTDKKPAEDKLADDRRADDRRTDDRRSDDRRADDSRSDDRRADDRRSDDRKADDRADDRANDKVTNRYAGKNPTGKDSATDKVSNRYAGKNPTGKDAAADANDSADDSADAQADDYRARMHAALDEMIERAAARGGGGEEEPAPVGGGGAPAPVAGGAPETPLPAEDVDLEELASLLQEYFEEEAAEPEHEGGGEPLPEGEGEPLPEEEPAPARAADGKSRARDGFIEPVPINASAAGNNDDDLMALRPFVARSNDAALKRAFNSRLARRTRSAGASNGSYAGFVTASRTRAADVAEPGNGASDRDRKLQAAYDAQRSGKPLQEVK